MEQLLAQRKPQYFAGTRPDFFWADLERAGHTRQQTGTSTYPDTWPRKAWLTAPVFESDWQFLARLGLLEPWEREAGDPGKGKGISK